jgi:predicted chitinase
LQEAEMTEPLDLSSNYTSANYRYKEGGDGYAVENGKKIVDCSHMVNLLLTGAGYEVPYQNTAGLNSSAALHYYDVISPANVKRGDIVLWINKTSNRDNKTLNHTGIVKSYDSTVDSEFGEFFGAQSSGPATAKFGSYDNAHFWPVPTKFLRVKESTRSASPSTPAAAPSVVPAASPLMSFQYPFRKSDGKQFNDSNEVYKALEAEKSGHYLLGSNKFWHGGIHISELSAPQSIRDQPIQCMADGVVVAYRLNDKYLTSRFGQDKPAKPATESTPAVEQKKAPELEYSNSFCLVRHDYKSPLNPEVGGNKDKFNTLTFYSLYMHLLPFNSYPLAPEETPKAKVKMIVGDFQGHSSVPWELGNEPQGKIAKNTELEIQDQKTNEGKTYAKGRILAGKVTKNGSTTKGVGDEIWFAYKENGESYKNSKGDSIYVETPIPERTRPGYWKGQVEGHVKGAGLPLFNAPAVLENDSAAGLPKGSATLCADSVVQFDSGKVINLMVGNTKRSMAECVFVPGVISSATGLKGGGSVPDIFWACVDDPNLYWHSVTPLDFNKVETVKTSIKAGDPIGYFGLNQTVSGPNGGVNSKRSVHVEIFSADPKITDFLDNKAQLKIGKQFLYVPKGTELRLKSPLVGTLNLKEEHHVELNKAKIFKDTEEWYDLTLVENGQAVSGLFKKQGAPIITQHDWAKLGFKIVKEENSEADGFLDPDNLPDFFKEIYAKIDRDGNGNVTADELSDAQKNPDLRERWSRVIALHPTEWKDESASPKWSRLKDVLKDSLDNLNHESERIDNLVFWNDLPAIEKNALSNGMIYHFHPVEFIANAKAQSSMIITLTMLKAIFKSADDPSQLQLLADELNPRLSEYKLDTPLRLSHFFAQVRVEVGDSYALVESLKYRPQVLINNFAYFKNRPDEADLYGFKPNVQSANQVEIANRAYNGVTGNSDLGNGNIASGDGWKYRGRGLKQLTGRYNYNDFTNKYPGLWPGENLNFINNPALLEQPKYAARSAVYFWLKNELYNIADKGDSESYVNDITKVINLHTGSYAERRAQFTRIWENEKIFR